MQTTPCYSQQLDEALVLATHPEGRMVREGIKPIFAADKLHDLVQRLHRRAAAEELLG